MKLKVTLNGVSYEVDVEVLDEGERSYNQSVPVHLPNINNAPAAAPVSAAAPRHSAAPVVASSEKTITAPVGGTIVEVKLRKGDKVTTGQEILILEAMKMHTSIGAPADGVIKSIPVSAGETVREGQVLVEFE